MADRILLSPPHLTGDEHALVAAALDSNWIAPLGPMVDRFEAAFAEQAGFAAAAALASGTAAIHLGLLLLGVRQGDVVIAPSFTFIGGVAPIVQCGAVPWFVDCEPQAWGPDPALVGQAVDRAHAAGRRVGAVIAVDLYGTPCDLDAIRAAAPGVKLLADAAEAAGARYRGGPVGAGADLAAFSFNGNKIITTSGGGMLCGHDPAVIARARFLASQAREDAPHYEHRELGFNYRMSNLLAAVGVAQLAALADRVAARRQIAEGYRQRLADQPGISFAPQPPWGTGNHWLTVIRIDPARFGADRDAVRAALTAADIEARPVWKPMHLQPVFAGAPMEGGALSEAIFADGLCLPSGSALADADLDRVAKTIRAVSR